tara:strand:+ start:252 stop:476 length:225 start_codon:yes stop_codon:yes gene_type:complete
MRDPILRLGLEVRIAGVILLKIDAPHDCNRSRHTKTLTKLIYRDLVLRSLAPKNGQAESEPLYEPPHCQFKKIR